MTRDPVLTTEHRDPMPAASRGPYPGQHAEGTTPSFAAVITGASAAALLAACSSAPEPAQRMLTETPTDRPDLLPRAMPSGSQTSRRIPTPDQFFAFIQTAFADFFPGNPTTQSIESPPAILGISGAPLLSYRIYANGTVVGIMGGQVLVISPALTGGALVRVGALADFTIAARSRFVPDTDTLAARFLLQTQFSATDEDIANVRALGFDGWLEQAMAVPRGQGALAWAIERGYHVLNETTGLYESFTLGDYALYRQLLSATDPVRQRAALALSEFFCVNTDPMGWARSIGPACYWDLLTQHAFGNYRDLLEAVTLNPLMGETLNTSGNEKENASGRVPDENYAREVMQLFSIGLYQLNLDGTAKLGADGQPIETYTNADVSGLARVFTGWQQDWSRNRPTAIAEVPNYPSYEFAVYPMVHDASKHSLLEKRFLGTAIPAGTAGPASLGIALDTLFRHPNVGPFLARQMIQRLVTSHPSPAYVRRVASVFNDNGAGVRGDLGAMFAAIWLDDEARDPVNITQPGFGKLSEPMIRFVQWARTFASNTNRQGWRIMGTGDASWQFGQSPLRSPSVFNFFRPGYTPPITSRVGALAQTAPEFQLVNETSVCGYVNFMEEIIRRGARLNRHDDFRIAGPGTYTQPPFDFVPAEYTRELAVANDTGRLLDRLSLVLCAGRLSAASRAIIARALDTVSQQGLNDDDRRSYPGITVALKRVHLAVFMVMISPDYVVQK